jgi:Protein tyrosine and serine/threonine kinase
MAAGSRTGRPEGPPAIKKAPEDRSSKENNQESGRQPPSSGGRATVPRLKLTIPQPQTYSTIPWPTASLQTINLPEDVISNTHESTRSNPWVLGDMVLYPAKSLGSGAYARVISGFKVSSSTGEVREVAIKVLSTLYKQEFARECSAMALLKDTQTLPQLFAAGQGNDYFYIVMVGLITYYETLN